MDKVLEFVSSDILGWNGLIKPQELYALEDTNAHLQPGYQLADKGRKAA
jgi:hypothetical protein